MRMIIAFSPFWMAIPAVIALYWVFKSPEEAFQPRTRRWKICLAISLFYIAGVFIVMVAGPKPFVSALWIGYPLIYGVLLRKPLRAALGGLKQYWPVIALCSGVLMWFQELFVAIDLKPDQISAHMLHFIPFYLGLAVIIASFRWSFCSVAQVFTVGGIWGVIMEQVYRGPQMLAKALTTDSIIPHFKELFDFIIYAGFTFPVYGFYLAGPFLLFYEEIYRPERKHQFWKSFVLFVAVWAIPIAVSVALRSIWTAIHPG